MKRIVPILIAAIAFGGCKWLPSRRKSEVIHPSHEFRQNWPASAPAPAPSPRPADSRPATTTAPATTAPSGYRVIGKPEVVAAAMLQVNDKFITLEQVLHPIRRELMAAGRGGGDFRRRAGALIQAEIRRQVQQTLILEEARRRLSEEEMKFVEKERLHRYRQALAEFGGSETLLAQRLKTEGTTLPAWQDEMRRALTVRVYLERSLLPQVAVNRKMMWDYYNGHIKEFRRPATVEIQLIDVPFSDYVTTRPATRPATEVAQQEARRKAREQIDAAVAALAGGEDFAKVAGKFSKGPMAAKGGVWPPLERGSLRAEAVETAAFSQKEGQVSGVIETPTGCYVVKTLRHRPGEKAPFEQVQAKIEAELRMQQYEKISGEYMRKVYSRAVIRGADAFEEAALDAAVRRYSR